MAGRRGREAWQGGVAGAWREAWRGGVAASSRQDSHNRNLSAYNSKYKVRLRLSKIAPGDLLPPARLYHLKHPKQV